MTEDEMVGWHETLKPKGKQGAKKTQTNKEQQGCTSMESMGAGQLAGAQEKGRTRLWKEPQSMSGTATHPRSQS